MLDVLPHALPLVLYLAIGLAAPLTPWADAARTIAAGAALLWFARRGAYPELRERPRALHALLGVAAGVAVGLAWVPLARLVPALTDTPRTGLDPAENLVRTAFRILGMVAVVPFAEELLVRSALPRLVDTHGGPDWRDRPVGVFSLLSAGVSIAFCTLSHPEWLAALATSVLWTWLLTQTRNLRVLVISHAVANATLAAFVLVTGETQWW